MRTSVRGAVSAAGMMIATGSQEFDGVSPYQDQNDLVQVDNGDAILNSNQMQDPGQDANVDNGQKVDEIDDEKKADIIDDEKKIDDIDGEKKEETKVDGATADVVDADAPKDNETAKISIDI